MSSGATLQNYNNELVKCLEDLREKRETLNKEVQHSGSAPSTQSDNPGLQVLKEEKKKQDIQKKLHKLTEEVRRICVPTLLILTFLCSTAPQNQREAS